MIPIERSDCSEGADNSPDEVMDVDAFALDRFLVLHDRDLVTLEVPVEPDFHIVSQESDQKSG